MKLCRLILSLSVLGCVSGYSQSLEIVDRQDTYQVELSETVKIPLRIKNTSDKPQTYVIRKVYSDLGSSQKGYFCLGADCLEPGTDEFTKRLEPGEIMEALNFTLETGIVTGSNNIKFEVFPRGNPGGSIEHNVSVTIDEKRVKSLVFQSRDITIHDVYPNPVSDQAFIDYKIHNENLKAKVVVHNILGRTMNEADMPASETRIKIQADELATGIYFYTVYLDNDGVLTRKLIVRK